MDLDTACNTLLVIGCTLWMLSLLFDGEWYSEYLFGFAAGVSLVALLGLTL